jgi:hypothetical protein
VAIDLPPCVIGARSRTRLPGFQPPMHQNWGSPFEYGIIYSIRSSLGGRRPLCSIYNLIDLTRSHVLLDRLLRETTSRLHDLSISNPLPSVLLSQRLSQGFPGRTIFGVHVSGAGGRAISCPFSNNTSNPRRDGPYPPPELESLESCLMISKEC